MLTTSEGFIVQGCNYDQAVLLSKFSVKWRFFKDGHIPPSFFIIKLVDKILLMVGFESRISGVGSDYSSN